MKVTEVLKRIRSDIMSGVEIEKCRDMLSGFIKIESINDDDLDFLCRLLSTRTPRAKLVRKIDKFIARDDDSAIAMNPLYVPESSPVSDIIHKCVMKSKLDAREEMFLCHNVPYFRNITDCRRYILNILGYDENYVAAIPKIFYIMMSNTSGDKDESMRFCIYVLGMCSSKIKELLGDMAFGFDFG